jgi:hypothetical protein
MVTICRSEHFPAAFMLPRNGKHLAVEDDRSADRVRGRKQAFMVRQTDDVDTPVRDCMMVETGG